MTTSAVDDRRPKLLVSVRDAEEVAAALAGGADWIDLKEPARGPLGAVDAVTARSAVKLIDAAIPVSAAAGELRDWPSGPARELLDVPRAAYLKLGLADCRATDWRANWLRAEHEILTAGKLLTSVAYADAARAAAPPIDEVLACAAESRSRWLVLDTFDKATCRLGDFIFRDALVEFLGHAQALDVQVAVAGRLDADAIAALPLELVDMIAVRSAACGGARLGSVDKRAVATLVKLLRQKKLAAANVDSATTNRAFTKIS